MSKILKGIGKVFKKIVKVGKIVIPIALGAAAVIFTGGAALGILPTFSSAIGGLVGGLGLSAGLSSALTAGIVNAGFGSAVGGILGGKKGMQAGFLAGAASGALGVKAIGSPGGLFGPAANAGSMGSGATASWGDATNSGVNGLLANGGDAITSGAPAAAGGASVAPAIAAPATAAAAPKNGLLPSFLSNPAGMTVAGNVLTGLFTPSEASTYANARARDASRLYGDIYSTGDNSGAPTGYTDPRVAMRPVRRFRLNPESLQVEEVANA